MWWQRKTSIEVKTRDDLVAALKTAPDEITVAGDPKLIEEAERLVLGTQKEVRHQFHYDRVFDKFYREQHRLRDQVSRWNQSHDQYHHQEREVPRNIIPPRPSYGAAYGAGGHSGRSFVGSVVKWILCIILFYLLAWLSIIIFRRLLSSLPAFPSPEGGTINYVALAWVVAAIVAMVLLYRVVMKAMQGERDVEISWKVTEKMSGKLVITKVQTTKKVSTRPPRKPKAA
jgi:hypothetical protein